MRETTLIEISLAAVTHNMAVLRRLVGPGGAICPVVKADGYGLGAPRVSACLLSAGADMLAVYTAEQAADLFRNSVAGPVLIMMPLRTLARGDELEHALVRGRLHLTVHDGDQLSDLIRLSERYTFSVPVHLDVDVGMSRGGCDLDDAPELLRRITSAPRLHLAGLSTHFSSAESDALATERQHERFKTLVETQAAHIPTTCRVHTANTAAALRCHEYHWSMIRVGQAWAGYGGESLVDDPRLSAADELRPSVTFSSRIIQLKQIKPRTQVGYGSTWTARRPTLLGLVPVGYADGYPLSLSNPARRRGQEPAEVALVVDGANGAERVYAPVVGRVNMDQITIDLTDIAGADGEQCPSLRVGTVVELITPDRDAPNHLVRLAQIAGSNPYELLCGLNPRIRRVYHHAGRSARVPRTRPAPAIVVKSEAAAQFVEPKPKVKVPKSTSSKKKKTKTKTTKTKTKSKTATKTARKTKTKTKKKATVAR